MKGDGAWAYAWTAHRDRYTTWSFILVQFGLVWFSFMAYQTLLELGITHLFPRNELVHLPCIAVATKYQGRLEDEEQLLIGIVLERWRLEIALDHFTCNRNNGSQSLDYIFILYSLILCSCLLIVSLLHILFPENISLFPLISWFILYLILQAFTNQKATVRILMPNPLFLYILNMWFVNIFLYRQLKDQSVPFLTIQFSISQHN